MDKFFHLHATRRALVGFLVVAQALTGFPRGYAADGSRHGPRGDVRGDDTEARDRIEDCLKIDRERDIDDRDTDDARNDADDGRDGDNGTHHGRRNAECLPGGSSSGISRGDFNGDRVADLAVGVPFENTPSGVSDSGAVNVIYGSATNGLTVTDPAVPPQFFSQNAVGIPFTTGESVGSEKDDQFGSALAAGNFNGDDYSDLAIGVPFESTDAGFSSGRVVVIYGSPNGLNARDPIVRAQTFDISDFDASFLEPRAEFGFALTWGDYNGDGFGDLAVGAPGSDLAPAPPCPTCTPTARNEAGAVFILFGSNEGLKAPDGFSPGLNYWDLDLLGGAHLGDRFGAALAGGDFDGNDVTDLAIGAPVGELGNPRDTGLVLVLFGVQDVGLQLSGFRLLDETILRDQGSVGFEAQSGARFGSALAAGQFDGDVNGMDDLAIGAPFRSLVVANRALAQVGVVWVIHGPVDRTGAVQFWSQSDVFPGSTIVNETNGTGSPSETGDLFGAAMAAGDFNGDALDDLAIGAPTEDVRVLRGTAFVEVQAAGAVTVVYGSARGLSITQRAPELWHQERISENEAEFDDRFGASLTAWNFGRNEDVLRADLAIGVPFENLTVGGQIREDCGQVNVLYSSSANEGLSTANQQRWHQGSHLKLGSRETGDQFGAAVY